MTIGARTYDASEIQKLLPQLEETIEKKERQIRQQQSSLDGQLKRITELEAEVKTLQVRRFLISSLYIYERALRERLHFLPICPPKRVHFH